MLGFQLSVMGAANPDLPVDDDDIVDIDDWREAVNQFLGQKYAMRFLSAIDQQDGTRFVDLRDGLPGSATTANKRKQRAAELYLIEKSVRSSDEGYGTHEYWELTDVGKHVNAELRRRQINTLHEQLKPLERQLQSHKRTIASDGLEMPVDPFKVFYEPEDQ